MTDGAGQENTSASGWGRGTMLRPARMLMVKDEAMMASDLCTQLTQMRYTVVGLVASEAGAMAQAGRGR
jgi:AmiR/NasT family two-component response regulator